MTREDRNYLFEEKAYLVNVTMNAHYSLIRVYRLDEGDVYQQLSLRLLGALDKYDSARCPNLDAYLMLQLRYELYHMTDTRKRTGVTGAPQKRFSLISLDALDDAGYPVQAPGYADDSNVIWLEREINSLPPDQRSTLSRLLSGKRVSCNNKSLKAARFRIRDRMMVSDRLQYA